MRGASILIEFIAGIIFATIIAPILDSAATVVIAGFEVIKGKFSVKIAEYNYQIHKLGEEEPTSSRIIGFVAPSEEDDDND